MSQMQQPAINPDEVYGAHYFAVGCGRPYKHPEWLPFFESIAERIVRDLNPTSVLDAGCAMGYLVEGFRKRDIDAEGIDVSDYAIQNVHPDIKDRCRVQSVTAPLSRHYDLITCIEVLEHLMPAEAEQAVANFCRSCDRVLFSSTPFDYNEATHVNVRPPEYWAELFARNGFYRDVGFDTAFLTPWCALYCKNVSSFPRVVSQYERRHWQLLQETQGVRQTALQQRAQLEQYLQEKAATEAALQSCKQDAERQLQELEEIRGREDAYLQGMAELRQHLHEVRSAHQLLAESFAGAIALRLSTLRWLLAPEATRRDRWLRLCQHGLGLWRRDGLTVLCRRAAAKAKRHLPRQLAAFLSRSKQEQPRIEWTVGEGCKEQKAFIGKRLAEWNTLKQVVEAVQYERDADAQLRPQQAGKEKDHRTIDDKPMPASQVVWMTRLLTMLRAEQDQVEKDLHSRLHQLLGHPQPLPMSAAFLEQCLQEWGGVPAAGPPKQARNSIWERLDQLGTRGIHILMTEGPWAFLIKGTRRLYRKLATWLPWGHPPGAPARLAPLPYIFRRAEESPEKDYAEWIKQTEPAAEELSRQRQTIFSHQPRISIVVPCYNTPLPFLLAMIESVRAQTYPHWELCLADGGSANPRVKKILNYYSRHDPRIKVALLPENQGIAGNSNAALTLATGDYLAFLDHDDVLSPFALFEVVSAVNRHPNADFLYSDEDKITESGQQRSFPHFKQAWAPDTLRSVNYICHLTIIGRTLLKKVGGFRVGYDGSQDYDLILRATEKAHEIVHIPKVLYHWRSHPQSVAGALNVKPYAYEAAKKALREHLVRCGIAGHVQHDGALDCYRIVRRLPRRPLVSIIIPNRDHLEALRTCLGSIAQSTYTNYEIIIVENNSQDPRIFDYYAEIEKRSEVRIIPWNHPFNYAAANNFGALQAQGEMLLLLNNDVEVINRDWLEALLEHALRSEVGAVGAKLYYPNGTIQHGGVVVGFGGVAGHAGTLCPPHEPGYMRRLRMIHNLSAVTAACLMTPRRVFHEVGGLDERFILAFNDIDFCLKVRRQGYFIVWTPYAELYHFESLSRGLDDTPEKLARFRSEVRLFEEKWQAELKEGDPFYSPNLNLESLVWGIRTNGVGPQHPRIVNQRSFRASQAA